jgi:UDP-N-acetylglucosamine 2-epimerase (non-hydrolysing)
LLDDPDAYSRMSRVANPYGDGRASVRIARQLMAEAGMPCSQAAC